MITEKNNVFYCDCGFSWRRGMSGSHNCEDRLRAKLTDMAVQLANAESKCRELAAENAGLKNFIINDCHVAHIEPETFYEEEVTRYVSADGYEPETPATDAFLAEVRASGIDEMAVEYRKFANKDGCSCNMQSSYNLTAERAESYAAYIRRKGAAL